MRQQLQNYICAMTNGLYVRTHEEHRAEGEIRAAAKQLRDEFAAGDDKREIKLYAWSVAAGVGEVNLDALKDDEATMEMDVELREPAKMLDAFNKMPKGTIMIARDFHSFLAGAQPNPVIVRKVKEAITFGKNSNKVFIIIGAQLFLPPELEKEMKVIEFALPGRGELQPIISGITDGAGVTLNGTMDQTLDAASGLTSMECADAASLAVIEYCLEGKNDLNTIAKVIAREKADTIKKNGILEVVNIPPNVAPVGGYTLHKEWQQRFKDCYSQEARDYGLPVPKGEFVVGFSGCGKSLGAYAIASLMRVPLLRMDFGKCMAGLVGGSEANVRNALATADAVGKCVLWIDEFEKGVQGGDSSGKTDGGTTSRVIGTYLQWAADRTSQVYVYATANNVDLLPPELLGAHRWDEIWFIDLPNEEERKDIWAIQITKHKRDPKDFELLQLARLSEGYSGAEIERLFVESMRAAFFDGRKEPTDLLIAQLSANLIPLSKKMPEKGEKLRAWAKGRARPASVGPEPAKRTRKLMAN